jgi:hypothetical protein
MARLLGRQTGLRGRAWASWRALAWLAWLVGLLGMVGGLAGAGCARTRTTLPVFDVGQADWHVEELPATWRPGRRAGPLEGTLLVAHHPDGRQLVQFFQQWSPVVTAQSDPARDAGRWQFTWPARSILMEGSGTPPTDVVWFWVDPVWTDAEGVRAWEFTDFFGGGWRMEHAGTGEMLEVRPTRSPTALPGVR